MLKVPVQSDSIPLINVYFSLCIGFSLFSMLWFSIVNYMRDECMLPKCLKNLLLKKYSQVLTTIRIKKSVNELETDKQLEKINKIETDISANVAIQHTVPATEKTGKKRKLSRNEISDMLLIKNLNKYVFYIFLFFFINLNLFCLIILPNFVRIPLSL